MRLTRLRKIGRFVNPETGRAVNVHQGRQVGRSNDVLFYLLKNRRMYITDSAFYHDWKKEIINE